MKQFQLEFFNTKELEKDLTEIKEYVDENSCSDLLFHIFCGILDKNKISSVIVSIKRTFPDANVVGCLSNGEIYEGRLLEPEIVITAYAFDSAKVAVKCYRFSDMQEEDLADKMLADASEYYTRAVEILAAKKNMEMWKIEKRLGKLDSQIKVFGGVSMGHDQINDEPFVFANNSDIIYSGVVEIIYYGNGLHVMLGHSLGWSPLGREMSVTKITNNSLAELDGIPAADIYEKYLGIEQDENFYLNALEFPLILDRGGVTLLREPFNKNREGSLKIVSDLFEGERVRIAYGDLESIVQATTKMCNDIRLFVPQAVLLFSCSARKKFLSYFVNKEMEPFQKIAPTSGFFSGGEIRREGNTIYEHNVCLVAVAFREGNEMVRPVPPVFVDESVLSGQLSVVKRLVNFAKATTRELEEVNTSLKKAVVIDGLTQVYNRRALERKIEEGINKAKEQNYPISFIMLDVDNFKHINDTFGHAAGDDVLRSLALILKTVAAVSGSKYGEASAGRFGGEEFILVLPGVKSDAAVEVAEKIRKEVESHDFSCGEQQTVSIGVTELRRDDSNNDEVSNRVDEALYRAKRNGRNQVVML